MTIYDPVKRRKLREKLEEKMDELDKEPEVKTVTDREIYEQAKTDLIDAVMDEGQIPWPSELYGFESGWLNARFNELAGHRLSGDEERFLSLCPAPEIEDATGDNNEEAK